MKKPIFILSLFVISLFFVNCEKETVNAEDLQDQSERTERISFLKSTSYDTKSDDQQPFQMLYARVCCYNDTVVNFIMEYKVGEDSKLHDFDFVWDGKFTDDGDGKKWMNIKIYHKTKVENPQNTVSDSAYVNIPQLLKIKEEDMDKTWLKFINSTDKDNILEVQFRPGDCYEGDGGDGGDETPVDSTSVSS